MNVKFSFDKLFQSRNKHMFSEMQSYVDNECIKCMTPYVPVAPTWQKNSGKLRDSVINPEPGIIKYTAPHANHAYYTPMDHSRSGNPGAQRLFFEYMKAKDGNKIRQGLSKIAKRR